MTGVTSFPDLPSATYDVWVRGYGLVDSPKVRVTPGATQDLEAVAGTGSCRGGALLSSRLLALAAARAGQGRVPGHGARRERDIAQHGQSGRMAQDPEVRRLHGMSSAGHEADARDSRPTRRVRLLGGRVGSAHPVRTGGRQYEQRPQPDGPPADAGSAGRLDRSDCGWRGARGHRPARRAWSAMWSSRSGTGPTRRRTCTTRCPPTSGTRPSTPTARSTARSRPARTMCPSSTRWVTRRAR